MKRNNLLKTAFSLSLAAVCAFAGLALTETTAQAWELIPTTCPATCNGTNLTFLGIFDCTHPVNGCALACRYYRDNNTGSLCSDNCYAY